MEGSKVHWFSILDSLMVITFLAGIVFIIFLMRTIRGDLARYKDFDKEAQAHMDGNLLLATCLNYFVWRLEMGVEF